MKPLLIHCHIYYPQLWAELKQCILNTKIIHKLYNEIAQKVELSGSSIRKVIKMMEAK